MSIPALILGCLLATSLTPAAALAHTGSGVAAGFSGGFAHPVLGLDHLVAMLAVGLWGTQLERPAIWVLPVTFPLVMAAGGFLGVAGVEFPLLEPVIAASALALGLMVALAARPPLWVAGLLVAAFALFHGDAHGLELPNAADPVAYALGFVTATGLIHLAGIGLGLLGRSSGGERLVRVGGAAVATLGAWFLLPSPV